MFFRSPYFKARLFASLFFGGGSIAVVPFDNAGDDRTIVVSVESRVLTLDVETRSVEV